MILKVKFKHFGNLIKAIFLLTIVGSIIINPLIFNLISPYYSGKNTNNLNTLEGKVPFSQSLTAENNYEGIGKPWNITHWANRTDKNLPISFSEGNFDTAEVPLGINWEGYKLITTIKDLTDTRNWNNGTFHYGADDGTYNSGENDSLDIVNSFQNWIFKKYDPDGLNAMSGNYMDINAPNSSSQDCLELRMDGELHNNSGSPKWYRYRYDYNDRCWWQTFFDVPRGKLVDCILKFQLNPIHLANFNSWEMNVLINDINVFTIEILNIKQMGLSLWHNFSIPLITWINTSDVFTSKYLQDSKVKMAFVLRYNAHSASYGHEDGENIDYQQILLDNVKLIFKAEAFPSNLGLQVNGTPVQDLGWGKGRISINGKWYASKVVSNFTTTNIGTLGQYNVDLKTNLNLYAKKDIPDSNYEPDPGSLGAQFSVGSTDSNVSWFSYGFIAVPTGYVETEMVLSVPTDFVFTGIYTPTEPSVNVISSCDTTTAGIIKIPVSTITDTPDGFWKFEARSPNYCISISIYSNQTGAWVPSNEFLSGQYINITASISTTPIISDHVQKTNALLQIRFPNGTIWKEMIKKVLLTSSGVARFVPFKIPSNPPNYEVGIYQAIVTWNNSYNSRELNESGVISTTFRVVHDSKLTPEKDFYPGNVEGDNINLRVSFNDNVDFTAIENATIYTYNFTHPSIKNYFSEVSPGSYFLEFSTIGAKAGNNTITIYAESINYKSTAINITIYVTKQTILTVDSTFLQGVPYKSNFTINFNYTEKYGGAGIEATVLSTDWNGTHHFKKLGTGTYQLTCNASGPTYNPGGLYTLILDVRATHYIPQSIPIRVYINELGTIIKLYINGTQYFGDELISFEVWQKMNVTIKYTDLNENHLSGANVKATIGTTTETLIEDIAQNQYTKIINFSNIGQGINYLSIFANKTFYNPQSVRVIIQSTERLTYMQVFFDGVNFTKDPTIVVPYGKLLNVTIKYFDSRGFFVNNASMLLTGDYSGTIQEQTALRQYSIIFNTTQFGLGVKIITVSAQKTDFQFQSTDLRIEVRKIKTSISLFSGQTTIKIKPGESITLRVVLTDIDFGGRILGADVRFAWSYGVGKLYDPDGDGIYEATIENIPAGSYIIVINAFAGVNYDFEPLQISVSALVTTEDIIFLQALIITAIALGAGFSIYYYLYRTIFRFPKPVRRVRKYERTLNKKTPPRFDIPDQKEAFRKAYNSKIEEIYKSAKTKEIAEATKPDKFFSKMKKIEPET